MPWIRFDPDGQRAPSVPLETPQGDEIEVADFRQWSNLVVFLSPARCDLCRQLVERFVAFGPDLGVFRAHVLVVVPSADQAPRDEHERVHLLLDPDYELWRRYADLVQRDTTDQAMLFVIDQYGVPYAAWVGKEPDEQVYTEAVEWLQFIALQCPE